MQLKSLLLLVFCGVFLSVASVPDSSYAAKDTSTLTKKKTAAKKTSARTVAKSGKPKKSAKKSLPAAAAPKFSALVVDADSGRVLYQKNAAEARYPASLTKMMTLYLTFDAIERGRLRLDSEMKVSDKAANQPQTNISLEEGDRLKVEDAIEALVVRSANDAAMVIAEELAGTQWNFALMMTKKAKELGMKDTTFRNPSGLPDDRQMTSAYDMARLGIALRRDFPQHYHYFSLKSFTYNGITYPTHNRVIARVDGADGLKTGYIRASGFNVVTSAQQAGYNLVAVVMGGKTASERDEFMVNLLERTFADLKTKKNSLAKQLDDGADEDSLRMAGL